MWDTPRVSPRREGSSRHRADIHLRWRPDARRHEGDSLVTGVPGRADPGHRHTHLWALNVKSRTLRAEIDLPNPGGQLLPGMYAYANVIIERPGVRALPVVRPDP